MAHLDDDVAAFVDGQLSPRATKAAARHLECCARCRQAVEGQQQLKARMRLSAAPGVPTDLMASLAGLSDRLPEQRTPWWSRFVRSGIVSAGVVIVGASLAVVAAAYAVGTPERRAAADPVVPAFDSFVADFRGATSSSQDTMTAAAMTSLDEQGWPCHSKLGANLERTDGRWHEGSSDTVALTYSDGQRRLRLFEQNGRLDTSAMRGFAKTLIAGHRVWVRSGSPKVVTWDSDGVVYTVVTDLGRQEIVDALRLLPRAEPERTRTERVENGMHRLASWIGAA